MNSAAEDDAPSAVSGDHDADAVRAARPDAASAALYNDAPSGRALASSKASSEPAAASTPSAQGPQTAQLSGTRTESVTIDSSFGEAMQRLGIDASITALLARSFAGQFDFRRDLRKGDRISLVMRHANDAVNAPSGRSAANLENEPLAVRVSRGDTDHDLFLRRDLKGKPFYYTANGTPTTPSFSRYPLAFRRVSSSFAARRLDPVTHQWQSHDGVDLAAPRGTPVHATAQGTVRSIGWETGYGRFIVIDNMPPYQTAFAHLSRYAKGLHRGSHVKRGEVIGYVGQTGWATGPHLHYEVRVNDVARNPLTVMLPGDKPLHGDERKRFAQQADRLATLL